MLIHSRIKQQSLIKLCHTAIFLQLYRPPDALKMVAAVRIFLASEKLKAEAFSPALVHGITGTGRSGTFVLASILCKQVSCRVHLCYFRSGKFSLFFCLNLFIIKWKTLCTSEYNDRMNLKRLYKSHNIEETEMKEFGDTVWVQVKLNFEMNSKKFIFNFFFYTPHAQHFSTLY